MRESIFAYASEFSLSLSRSHCLIMNALLIQETMFQPVCLRGDVDADLVATNSVITRYYSAAGSVSQKRSLYGNKEQFIDTRPLKGARALLTGRQSFLSFPPLPSPFLCFYVGAYVLFFPRRTVDQGALKEAQREYTQGKAEHAELMRSHQVIADEIRPLKSQIENIDRALVSFTRLIVSGCLFVLY